LTEDLRSVPIPPEIVAFYNEGREVQRLTQGLGRLEFLRMQEMLTRYLPPVPSSIADIGGGPGGYASWLAAVGYDVHLVDPIPLHVAQAGQASDRQPTHPIRSCQLGEARSVPLADASVDAVLLHGPLYHLTERDDRLLALREAARVLKPGGHLCAVAICAYASTIVGLVKGWVWDHDYLEMIAQEILTGQHRRPANWAVMTTAYFHHPAELAHELVEAGFEHTVTLGIQGPGWLVPDFDRCWDEPLKRDALMKVARLVELEPAHSPHMMAVARTPQP
jgi:ubiquinone/menaquinone biosynthesis C-methylase UbiE